MSRRNLAFAAVLAFLALDSGVAQQVATVERGTARRTLVQGSALVFGYFPARKAARLHPIEALRHE